MDQEATKVRLELIREIGLMAYRFLITLNSGAFIVLLTFVANVPIDSRFQIELEALKGSMFSFLLAIALTFLSMTIAYISAQLQLLETSLPFGGSATGHIIWLTFPVVCAFASFVIGVVLAINGVS